MRLLRLSVLPLLLLGCSDVSDKPDAKPEQMFDAPGPPPADARIDASPIDAATPDALPVDAAPDA